ncbi:MAG TPA: MATE family efflux transporter, partial [Chitinophagaceae bacterium]|nr:MATE family efflux transporter [Chitinophagaceae bacterium]
MQTSPGDLKVVVSNRQILQIALPISASLIIPNLNFLTNSIFLGGLGVKELGNAGITGVYYLVLMFAGSGFSNALQAIISRQGGEGRKEEIHKSFVQGQRIVLLFSVAGILFTWFIAPSILKYFVRPQDFNEEINFLKIRVFGLPFLYLFQAGNAFLISTLNSRYLLVGTIGQALINIFFDYSLIYGNFNLPQLGFNGAAVASVIAEISGMIIVYTVIFKMGLKDEFHLFEDFRFNKAYSKIVLNISAPLVLQYVLSTVTWLAFFILLEQYGEQAKAISNAMRNVFSFAGVLVWAFASTSNIMVSNLIGQGRYDTVSKAINKIMIISIGATISILIVLNLFAGHFLKLFGQDASFIHAALPVMRVVSVAMIMMSIATIWLNAVTGTGKTKMNLLI